MGIHKHHEVFIKALHAKNMVVITFHSKDDGTAITRLCAPTDFGPSRRKGRIVGDGSDKYHFFDYESDKIPHPLSLNPDLIVEIAETKDVFNPGDFIRWSLTDNPWFIERDWGDYS